MKIWKCVKKFVYFFVYRFLRIQLSVSGWNKLLQFIKFGLVGMLNSLISYGTYVFLVSIGMHYTASYIIGFSVSVFNSYYWNNKYVFKNMSGTRTWWKAFVKTYISYAGTGIILSNVLLFIWIEKFYISQFVAPILNLIVTIPINFLVNKYWAYRSK